MICSVVLTFVIKYKSHESRAVAMLVDEDLINILVVGLDYKPHEWPPNLPFSQVPVYDLRSHSDVIMIVSIQPSKNKVNLLSIPRDTLVEYKGELRKINHAFASGGINALINTIEKHLLIKIHNFALLDFYGFEELIDVFGGIEIEIENDLKMPNGAIVFKKGKNNLTGAQALKLVRHRMGDPLGDIGRIGRQHLFMEAFYEKVKSASVNTIIQGVYVGHKIVKTDMSPLRAIALARMITEHLPSFNYHTMPGEYIPPDEWRINTEYFEREVLPDFT